MRANEWSLIYSGTSLTFGPADLPIVNLAAPDLGDPDVTTDDTPRPRADGVSFGVDYRGGRTVTFTLALLGDDETDVRDTLATLAKAWRADAIRSTPGALAELHMNYAGRERVIYGRPRRFAVTNDDAYTNGVIEVLCDFAAVDDAFYAASDGALTLAIIPPSSGGIAFPAATPFTTTASSDQSEGLTVGGDAAAWPYITINGPITNPSLTVTGLWTLAFTGSLAAGDHLRIDTRPWARTALLNSWSSWAGKLTRTSARLSAASIPPGDWEAVLGGIDGTGTASASITWRETYSAI